MLQLWLLAGRVHWERRTCTPSLLHLSLVLRQMNSLNWKGHRNILCYLQLRYQTNCRGGGKLQKRKKRR